MRTQFIKTVAAGVATVGLGALLAQAGAPSTPQGVITAKNFFDIGGGTAVTDLTGNAKFPNSPDVITYPGYFELYATGDIATPAPANVNVNCGAQMVGYFYPDTTGDYYFYISADDNAALYLSTDTNPANKKLIARETSWSNPREYTSSSNTGATIADKASFSFTGTEWPTKDANNGGAKITLTKGQAYYIEALQKQGTGGDNLSVSTDGVSPIPGSMLSSFDKNTGPVTIATQPASQTVVEGQSGSFKVVADGTPPYTYQWQKGGTDVTDATNATLTLTTVAYADNNAQFTCKVSNGTTSATSQPATLTVTRDTQAPTVVSASADLTFTTVVVAYSEPVSDTAINKANYAFDQGITVASVARVDAKSVKLTTSTLTGGVVYNLTINNVQDMAATPNTIAANTKVEVRPFVYMPGFVVHQKYSNVTDGTGSTPDGLFNDPRYSGAPDRTDLLSVWEYPKGGAGRDAAADPSRNYFDTIDGFFVPPQTGDYVFFICGADRFWLYLSTDEKPENKHLIAAIPGGWTNPRQWMTGQGGQDMSVARSDTFPVPDPGGWPNGNTITLQAGKKYYLLEVHHDPSWCGADDFSATYKLAGDADPADGDISKLSGNVIGTYLNPVGASITFSQQPQNAQVTEARSATFTAAATGSSVYGAALYYQWQTAPKGSSTWTDIAGATMATYTTPGLALADDGRQYRVVASVPAYSQSSAAATVSVIADTVPPVVLKAGAVKNQAGTYDIGIQFDERLTASTAAAAANYTLSSGTVTAANYMDKTPGVILTASGLTPGNTYTLTVKNVADVKNNVIVTTNLTFAVSAMTWGQVGDDSSAGSLNLGFPAGFGVVAVATNGFDVYSDGIGEWGTYDETTFVYEPVTGDFDKKLRIEYQDGSSQWARAGLIMREDLTVLGMNADTQNNGGAGRYQKIHVNPNSPTLTSSGLGNNSWEGNRRLDVGGASTSASSLGADFGVLYPNAWVRLQRSGQMNNIFRSDDGVSWVWLGRTTWGVDDANTKPMPNTVYVGPEYTPENGNVAQASDKGRFLAKFRDYGDTWAPAPVVAKRDYSIGLNFGAEHQGTTAPAISSALAATDVAGVPGLKQKNWNNINAASGTKASLVADKAGTATPTTATVTWAGNGTWSTASDGETNNSFKGADFTLMHGYLDTGDSTTSTVTVSGAPDDLTANGYDVYVYLNGGVGPKGGGYRILDADSGAVLKDYVFARGTWYAPDYYPVPAGTTTNNFGVGNYIVFTGLKAKNIKIEATTANGLGTLALARGLGTPRAPINAIQLVAPTTGSAISNPTLDLQKTAQGWSITYQGVLYSADSVNGPWTPVAGASSPYSLTTTGAQKFFRAGAQ